MTPDPSNAVTTFHLLRPRAINKYFHIIRLPGWLTRAVAVLLSAWECASELDPLGWGS